VSKQCELVGLFRSSYYYRGHGESEENLTLMRLIDEQYLRRPFYGSPRMTAVLRRMGYKVNHKRVERLMRVMGREAVYPEKKTSPSHPGHRIYPYLLADVGVSRPDQVWGADIIYIRLAHGFVYLVVVMDWWSRYVLSWEVSTWLDRTFCLDALERALTISLRSLILAREANLPVWSLPGGWKGRAFESRWIVGEGFLITFLWSGSLER